MPLPMVHLLTARLWAEGAPELLESPDFYLGAISPDAIHIRRGVTRADKAVTHLDIWAVRSPKAVLEYLAERPGAFDIGYALHILTDLNWVRHVRAAYPGIVGPDDRMIGEIYYHDCEQADEALYASSPGRAAIWRLLERARAPEDHPLLSAREIEGWKARVLVGFGLKPKLPSRMLEVEAVRGFIRLVQPLLSDLPRLPGVPRGTP